MNQSRIKKIRNAARLAVLAAPNLKPDKRIEVYQNVIRTMKASKDRRYILANIPKEFIIPYKKKHTSESLEDFKIRRKASNKRRRIAEKLNA